MTDIREPFHNYKDDYEITLVVGYDGTIENFGTYTWIQKGGLHFTDAGCNIFSSVEAGKVNPWVETMWKDLEIPWALPGKDIGVDIVINEKPLIFVYCTIQQ